MHQKRRSSTVLGLGLALGGLALLAGLSGDDTHGSSPELESGASTDGGAVAEGRSAGSPSGDPATAGLPPAARAQAVGERGGWADASRDRLTAAYRSDQVLVALGRRADLGAVAAAHGLRVLREPGRSGVAALHVPADRDLSEVMTQLGADPAVSSVMPNATTRGAADAESMQQDADKDLQRAEREEHKAQAAAAELDALIAEGASATDIEEAREDADRTRAKADKAWKDAAHSQDKAEKRAQLEYRAQVRSAQLHLMCSNHPKYEQKFEEWDAIPEPDHSGVTVAILDTGVAYRDTVDGTTVHVAAPSLSSSGIVSPIDLVNDDDHAGDDHQHGTHIASIISSSGDLVGLAPGTTLMPVKVLDANNEGTELDLVEGILHAVDAGADIINLSLSFGEGYIPSPMLAEALEQAHQAGVVMIAASGNDPMVPVSWPAASPRVVAVASADIDQRRDPVLAPYASTDPRVDITALGGHSGVDNDGDGFDDGILAETIAPQDPSQTGYWFYAGTSQAAAVVTGATVRLMASGLSASDALRLLQYGANTDLDGKPYLSGWGAGVLDLGESERLANKDDDRAKATEQDELFVSIHPSVRSEGDGEALKAQAHLMVVDRAGQPVKDVVVVGHVSGGQDETWQCSTGSDGQCDVRLDKIELEVDNGRPIDPGLAWIWQVDSLIDRNEVSSRFSGLLYATAGLDALAGSQRALLSGRDGALAIYWPPGTDDDELGELAESYTVLHANTGGATAPVAIALTAGLVNTSAAVTDHTVQLDGSGISTSPFGLRMRLVDFDGSGISTSPFGFRLPPLMAVDGAGLSTSPFGLHPLGITQPMDGSGLSTSPFGIAGAPVLLSTGTILGSSETDGALSSHLSTGGWQSEDGLGVGAVLAASGVLDRAQPSTLKSDTLSASSVGSGGQATTEALSEGPLPTVESE